MKKLLQINLHLWLSIILKYILFQIMFYFFQGPYVGSGAPSPNQVIRSSVGSKTY